MIYGFYKDDELIGEIDSYDELFIALSIAETFFEKHTDSESVFTIKDGEQLKYTINNKETIETDNGCP